MEELDDYSILIDSDCLNQDFDDYDLYGERIIESDDSFGDDIQFE